MDCRLLSCNLWGIQGVRERERERGREREGEGEREREKQREALFP